LNTFLEVWVVCFKIFSPSRNLIECIVLSYWQLTKHVMKIILVNDSRYLIIEEIQFQHKFIVFFYRCNFVFYGEVIGINIAQAKTLK
jgi:hypothetical protein